MYLYIYPTRIIAIQQQILGFYIFYNTKVRDMHLATSGHIYCIACIRVKVASCSRIDQTKGWLAECVLSLELILVGKYSRRYVALISNMKLGPVHVA
jgi:hypothetical protein